MTLEPLSPERERLVIQLAQKQHDPALGDSAQGHGEKSVPEKHMQHRKDDDWQSTAGDENGSDL